MAWQGEEKKVAAEKATPKMDWNINYRQKYCSQEKSDCGVDIYRVTNGTHIEYLGKNSVPSSPHENYTDKVVADGQRSWCQLLWVEGCRVGSATGPQGR